MIWQAGRATSATGLAFKPIQIGQSVFIDEGAGKYNPSPVALDEATINEWPGRDVGVFVTVGTGKRPPGSDHNKHLWYEDLMSEFVEARKRLVAKIEGCEETHQYMVQEYLAKRGVTVENYYRLNVEVGVGEFAMNEWNRLADISTSTKRYLGKAEVQRMNQDAAAKLARIHRAKARLEGREVRADLADIPEAYPMAVELPAEVPVFSQPDRSALSRPSYENGQEMLTVPHTRASPRSSGDHGRHSASPTASGSAIAGGTVSPFSSSSTSVTSTSNEDRFVISAPTPSEYGTAADQDKITIISSGEYLSPSERVMPPSPPRQIAPPLPPKMPLKGNAGAGGERRRALPPYPLDDRPPPIVNMARKPDYRGS
jgi:hypothetical protein